MWEVHVVGLSKLLLFKNLTRCRKVDFWQSENVFSQNLTTRKNFYSKSCFLQKVFRSNLCFLESFFFKIVLFRKFLFFKIVLFKIARQTQKLRILRGELKQNVNFVCKTFFKICFSNIIFSSKLGFLKNYFCSKSCFLQKLFRSKLCFLETFFSSKSSCFSESFFLQNCAF